MLWVVTRVVNKLKDLTHVGVMQISPSHSPEPMGEVASYNYKISIWKDDEVQVILNSKLFKLPRSKVIDRDDDV